MATSEQVFDSYSCQLCDNVDTMEMVQCDYCDRWYHFTCEVADRNWSCERCDVLKKTLREYDEEKSRKSNTTRTVPEAFSYKSKASTKVSSLTTKQKSMALRAL